MATTRILVVDDEEDLCEILKFNLEIEGYEVGPYGKNIVTRLGFGYCFEC